MARILANVGLAQKIDKPHAAVTPLLHNHAPAQFVRAQGQFMLHLARHAHPRRDLRQRGQRDGQRQRGEPEPHSALGKKSCSPLIL
jgi:hypothetical protein